MAFADDVTDADIARFRQACAEVIGSPAAVGWPSTSTGGRPQTVVLAASRRMVGCGAEVDGLPTAGRGDRVHVLARRPAHLGTGGTGMESVLDGPGAAATRWV